MRRRIMDGLDGLDHRNDGLLRVGTDLSAGGSGDFNPRDHRVLVEGDAGTNLHASALALQGLHLGVGKVGQTIWELREDKRMSYLREREGKGLLGARWRG